MDEIQNLLLRVQGEEDIKRLNAELAKGNDLLAKLMKMQAQGIDKKASIVAIAQNQLDRHAELDKIAKDLATKIPKGSQFSTQGVTNLAYAIQDFTSAGGGWAQKLNAVSNNLQQFALASGAGGGLLIGITGLVAGVQLLMNNWEKIDAWLSNLPDPEKVKRAAEFNKSQQEKLASVLNAVTPAQTAAAGATQEAITAIGGPKIQSKLEESLAASGAGWGESEMGDWRKAHGGEFPDSGAGGKDHAGFIAAMQLAESTDKRARAQKQVQDLLTTATGTTAAAPGARAQLEAIMRANPGRFTPGDIANLMAGSKELVGPHAPEMNEKRAADLQRQLEARGEGVSYGSLYGPGVGAGSPVVEDKTADVRATMQSNRQARAEAMGAGTAGPAVQTPQRRPKRRKYQQTAPPDPAMAEAQQAMMAAMSQANQETNALSQMQMQPGMSQMAQMARALQMKQAENARMMSQMFGGPTAGSATQLPEFR
jgi:hypothetical protein